MTNETDEQIVEECRTDAEIAHQEEEDGHPNGVTKDEMWRTLKRYRRRIDASRQKDDLIERMMVQIGECHSTIEKMARESVTPPEGEIHLDFPVEGGCFSFSCPPSALSDPDVRDALAKGRAILEKLGC